jgi:hypothetical protein
VDHFWGGLAAQGTHLHYERFRMSQAMSLHWPAAVRGCRICNARSVLGPCNPACPLRTSTAKNGGPTNVDGQKDLRSLCDRTPADARGISKASNFSRQH